MINHWSNPIRVITALVLAVCAGCTSTGGSAPDRSLATKPAASNPDQRVALVIGNSKYAESPLINPANDARAMTSTLAGLGFTVTSLFDASLTEMNEAARQFGDKLRAGGTGLFFYAGHGMQIRGRNFPDSRRRRHQTRRRGAVQGVRCESVARQDGERAQPDQHRDSRCVPQ